MNPTYYATPAMPCCGATARTFPDATLAGLYAQQAADAFRVVWTVFRILAGRPRKLAAYSPTVAR